MNPISIVIITLNEEKRIGRLLEDLTKQTHQNFEVIVVDSNSEDSTREVAQAYESSLPELTVHRMDTRGVSLGRNTGINHPGKETVKHRKFRDVELPGGEFDPPDRIGLTQHEIGSRQQRSEGCD